MHRKMTPLKLLASPYAFSSHTPTRTHHTDPFADLDHRPMRRQPRRLQFITDTTNTGEHQELRRLRQSDPELYELKLFEWDYVSQIDDLQETTPDLDDPGAPEVFFAVSGQQDEPATRTSSFVGARTTHLG